ncbi:T9SS type A sorting domain-containing protein [Roseivirga pacifica]|uniref:T9SS type A sorting domain-containing protein n=1 Tax=Roseivirga pacifica TaxID=1267423 RepID=UPI003BAF7DC1
MKKLLLLIILAAFCTPSFSQKMERLDKEVKIICYASEESPGTRYFGRFEHKPSISKYAEFSTTAEQAGGATIEVTYNGFSEEAQEAFQKAIDIWSQLISSDVVIRVNATWSQLDEGTLGSAIWNTAYRNFDGAKELDVWYPVALAEKMAGVDLNGTDEADIVANFNKGANWYLGTDGNPALDQYDLVSVVLHELGHGLGFVDSFDYSEDSEEGSFGINDFPFIYDLSVENAQGQPLVELVNEPADLGTALTSNSVFFNSLTAVANDGVRPKLYAPATWSGGSSIAHLNEGTYPSGSANSLMTPQIGANEVIHDPGPITLNMFGDMGWETTYIDNITRPNTENSQADTYTITAEVVSDVGYNPEGVQLYYSTDAFANDTTVVQMTATGNGDEFTAEINSTKTEGQVYTYFFKVEDIKERIFNSPSLLLADRYYSFSTGSDTEAPVITHVTPNFIRTTDTQLKLEATVTDFLPVEVSLEYFVNSEPSQTADFILSDADANLFSTQIDLSNFNLQEGSTISYKITATDESNNQNTATNPETGFTELNVVSTPDPASFFFTDFNDITAAADEFFNSANFTVKEESGFSNGALHSDHPYADGTGANDESNYTIELKTPIILNDGEAIISFDEVVLVEPGEATSEFGDSGYYDYVIVEGSKDGGSTWLPLADGYDSRAITAWSTLYNNNIDVDNNSTAVGDESLYRSRSIDMLGNGNFSAGDEIFIRFRLFADQAAHGWGWAIDNLNVQLDLEAPVIVHNHLNYLTSLDNLEISATVTDNFDVDSVGLKVFVNDLEQPNIQMTNTESNQYRALIDISSLQVGDVIRYRLAAFDTKEPEANASFIPGEDSFLELPIIAFGDAQATYSNDFNTSTEDFVGNFFSIATPSGFSDGAIHSTHPYPLAFGSNGRSAFTYMLKTPIIVSETKPLVSYDEVLLIDSSSDYAAFEASKDGGETWFEVESYETSDEPNLWLPVYQAGNNGEAALLKNRIVRLTDSPQIAVGDEILIRFKIDRRSTAAGWGWAIDNLEVQTEVITSLEDNGEIKLANIYPNPVKNGNLNIQIADVGATAIDYSIVTMSGQEKLQGNNLTLDQDQKASIDVSTLPSGLFMLKVVHKGRAKVYKVLKQD